jgi:hypothetical protein
VIPQEPDVAELGRGRAAQLRDHLVVGIVRLAGEDHVDLSAGEAHAADLDVRNDERLQLDPQQVGIPSGVERDLVVGDAQRTLLIVCETWERDGRDGQQAQLAGGDQPTVTGNQLAFLVD